MARKAVGASRPRSRRDLSSSGPEPTCAEHTTRESRNSRRRSWASGAVAPSPGAPATAEAAGARSRGSTSWCRRPCLVCRMGSPPLCQCDCDGCTAMKVDQAWSCGPSSGPEESEELACKNDEVPLDHRSDQDHTDHELHHRALVSSSVCYLFRVGRQAKLAARLSFAASH